ncbi:hemin receptor [Stappia sp. F7233]|uniref:Hemin receptor n=1 Tax=Stappia albiluteola TaxID=2758565 RepID=A0A839ADC4_9HYPH|nr:globin family protein [Stappia albiluteola]MBA5777146.1 hemin receptor [Stappia albiluteola]
MEARQIELVQASFAEVAPIADTAAGIFYTRLFDIAPEVRPLFKSDLSEQGRKLMATLGTVVRGLGNLEQLLPIARGLAARHVDYGVRPEHYQPVGEALIYTLQTGLGEKFTEETKQAWLAAYGALSGAMIAEAYGRRAAE